MKNGKAILLSAAVVLVGGGMIFGNHMLASGAFAAGDAPEQAIVMPEAIPASAMGLSDVGMYGDSNGVVYLAAANRSVDVQKQEEPQIAPKADSPETYQNPIDGNLSEDEAKQTGIKAIAEKFGLTAKEIDLFDVTIRGRYYTPLPSNIANMKPTFAVAAEVSDTDMNTQRSDEAYQLIWSVRLTPIDQKNYPTIDSYRALFEDNSLELMNVHAIPLIKEGTPLANEITSDKAKELAIAAIVQKYAITQKTLDKFTITTKYYEVTDETPDKHSWWVNLYPTNTDEFSEIGCYWSYVDAETGEILQLNSVANGKG